MKIEAVPILTSVNMSTGDVLSTWIFRYPRMILAEVNTHRMLSRNTASSRAVPAKKMRQCVVDDPFIPIHMGANEKGMQASEELHGWRRKAAFALWDSARWCAVAHHWAMDKLGVHKQVANRLVEPWMWTEQVVSATDWDNLIRLRAHKDAEPHFQKLAGQFKYRRKIINGIIETMRREKVYRTEFGESVGTIQLMMHGAWHLPFADGNKKVYWSPDDGPRPDAITHSVARCARTSYFLPENGEHSTIERDSELHDRLLVRPEHSDNPLHMSPAEHQARALRGSVRVGNFKGWAQYRKFIRDESGQDKEPHILDR